MNNKNQVITVLGIAAIIIALYLYMEDKNNKERITELEDEFFKLKFDSLKSKVAISVEVETQISELIIRFSQTDQNIARELAKVMSMLEMEQKSKAIESLAKIMEHLLKKLYLNKQEWKAWMKKNNHNVAKPHLHDLLTYCYENDKRISKVEFQFYSAVKEVRNREAHDVNYMLERNLNDAGLLAAISGILSIQSILDKEIETERTNLKMNGFDNTLKKSKVIDDGILRDAKISDCGNYRYSLSRIWDTEKPKVLFVMVNPSNANALEDDATIRRCMGYAKSWDYGGLFVTNLFAYINKDPKTLVNAEDPVGSENHKYIKKYINKVDKVICAWGNRAVLKKLGCKKIEDELKMLKYFGDKLHYLELAVDGTPKHPGRLKNGLIPKRFETVKT